VRAAAPAWVLRWHRAANSAALHQGRDHPGRRDAGPRTPTPSRSTGTTPRRSTRERAHRYECHAGPRARVTRAGQHVFGDRRSRRAPRSWRARSTRSGAPRSPRSSCARSSRPASPTRHERWSATPRGNW